VSEASDFATVISDACNAPRAFLIPPPLRGRVGEGGNTSTEPAVTPTPDPSPQGGGESGLPLMHALRAILAA
jgi:hypothetical protein